MSAKGIIKSEKISKMRGIRCLCYIVLLLFFKYQSVDATQFVQGTSKEKKIFIIALDPGHGGEENGAWYYGRKEKELNRKLAKYLMEELTQYPDIHVVLTREDDETIDLKERVVRAADAGADIYISLHFNASILHQASGATVYVTTAEDYRKQMCELADCLLGEFVSIGLRNNGTLARVTQMGGRREDGSFEDYYGVLRHSYNYGMPAILIEHCFMDNEYDLKYVIKEAGLRQLARADARGIAAYFGFCTVDGKHTIAKHIVPKGATAKGIEQKCYVAPNINGIQLLDYDGISPGIATYEIDVTDENAIVSAYLVYKNERGDTFTIPLQALDRLDTGKHKVKALIPAGLERTTYQLSYIGAISEAGYDAGYNYADGKMIGFGKCDWLNVFSYRGEATIEITEQKNQLIEYERWIEYIDWMKMRCRN